MNVSMPFPVTNTLSLGYYSYPFNHDSARIRSFRVAPRRQEKNPVTKRMYNRRKRSTTACADTGTGCT